MHKSEQPDIKDVRPESDQMEERCSTGKQQLRREEWDSASSGWSFGADYILGLDIAEIPVGLR
jgi:hypothetical protein